jgi:hypothetical protein
MARRQAQKSAANPMPQARIGAQRMLEDKSFIFKYKVPPPDPLERPFPVHFSSLKAGPRMIE